MQGRKAFEEEAAEQARQDAHGQEEGRLAGDPARPVRRQAAAGNDDVDVGMMGERRAPSMEDGGEADARAQMLRAGGDGGQRLGRGPELEVVDDGLVLERDRADRRRQREDDVIIGDRQEFRLALGEPLPRRRALTLRAMAVAARIVGDALVRAVLTAVRQVSIADMTFNWPRLTWPTLAFRHAAPWARKTSAPGEAAPCGVGQAGEDRLVRLRPSRSSGLLMSRIVWTATRV